MQEDYFGDLVDVIFVGEAEETWPRFLDGMGARAAPAALRAARKDRHDQGAHAAVRPAQDEALRLRQSPVFARLPVSVRVLRHHRHLRPPPADQDERADHRRARRDLRSPASDIVFIVDDNLIGNKKAIKEVLREVIAWQERHNYPLTFFTEASIDLADDPELMELMVQANFIATFIGIESPDEDSLREAKKFQNVRTGGTLLEKVHRIQEAGMEVWCGMIMGFDSDDEGIFDRQVEFIQDARIPFSMSGMLSAIPKTPLHDRLAAEGRLDRADVSEFGTNVVPSADEPRGPARRLSPRAQRAVRPAAYFERTEALFLDPSNSKSASRRSGNGASRASWGKKSAIRSKPLASSFG